MRVGAQEAPEKITRLSDWRSAGWRARGNRTRQKQWHGEHRFLTGLEKHCRGLNDSSLLERLMAEMANRAVVFCRGRGMVVPDDPCCCSHDQKNSQDDDRNS